MIFDDYIVRETPLPPGIHGMIKESPDGYANIYLNQADSEEEKRKTLRHELKHYRLGHLTFKKPVAEMEAEAECE